MPQTSKAQTSKTVEVAIVGNGIAGLVLSILLKRKGIEHVVINRQLRGQKRLALGETLPPSAIPLLQSLKLDNLFQSHALRKTQGYHISWGHQSLQHSHFYAQHPQAYGLKLNKRNLIQELELLAGPRVSCDRPISVTPHSTGISLTTTLAEQAIRVNAKLGVDATGRSRALVKQLIKPDKSQYGTIEQHDKLIAFSCHLPRSHDVNLPYGSLIESFEQGWGIASDLSDSHLVLSLFTNPQSSIAPLLKIYENWSDILAQTHWLKQFLAPTASTAVVGADASTSKIWLAPETKLIAIGDAMVAFDPLSSHGITNSIFTASDVAKMIEQYLRTEQSDIFQNYQAKMDQVFAAYLKTRKSLYQRESRWQQSPFWSSFRGRSEFVQSSVRAQPVEV